MAKQPAKGRKPPAKPKKPTQSRKTAAESAKVTKLQVDAIPAEVHKKPTPELSKSDATATEAKKPVAETASAPEKPVASSSPTPQPAKQTSLFIPLLIGGIIAGGIGFGIATITNTTFRDQIAQQGNAIAAVETEVANLPVVDLSAVEAAQTALGTQLTDMNTSLSDVEARLTALENLPRGEGVGSVPAIAAYEAELDALRAQISEMTGIAQTELESARAEAAAIEENAAAAARAAAGRAALARLRTGMENGAPLGAALADLEDAIGEPAPDALIAAQDGIPTLASLQEQFPDVARAALATARREGVSGEDTDGVGAFLRNQFDVRSVTPQQGPTTDAILSRAQGAVGDGRLSEALAEISALPEVARAEMSDWLDQAEARADAIAAVDILSTSLSDN